MPEVICIHIILTRAKWSYFFALSGFQKLVWYYLSVYLGHTSFIRIILQRCWWCLVSISVRQSFLLIASANFSEIFLRSSCWISMFDAIFAQLGQIKFSSYYKVPFKNLLSHFMFVKLLTSSWPFCSSTKVHYNQIEISLSQCS